MVSQLSKKKQILAFIIILVDIALYIFAFGKMDSGFLAAIFIIISIPALILITNYNSFGNNRKFRIGSFLLPGILIITALIYIPSLQYGFINWDDPEYIINNHLIKKLSFDNISEIFSSPFNGMYQPLSILSLFLDYLPAKLNPIHFHLTNLIFHLLNTYLVYKITRLLFDNINIAIISGLLFGIHPVHTESVIWITERKDVLFSFFFLLSLNQYIISLKSNSGIRYLSSLLFFIFSLLAKPQGVMLAGVIILTDYLLNPKEAFSKPRLLKNAPYFIIALFWGILTLYLREGEVVQISTFDRLVYGLYAYSAYAIQLIIPYNLSAIYPYPISPGFIHFTGSIFTIMIISWGIYNIKRNKAITYGVGFFTLNILLLLQFIPNTYALRADRYNYLPSIGIFILIGLLYNFLTTKYKKQQTVIKGIFFSLAIIMIFSSFIRGKVWESSISLWDDTLNKHPNIAEALNNRGHAFYNSGEIDLALKDFNKAIKIDSKQTNALINRGTIYLNKGLNKEALNDFNNGLLLNPEHVNGLINRGIIYKKTGEINKALVDYSKAIKINPYSTDAYINRGALYESKYDFQKAIEDYTYAISLDPKRAMIYSNLGLAYARSGNEIKALINFNKCIDLDPELIDAYSNRGFLYYKKGDYYNAIADFGFAIKLNPDFALAYMNRGNAYISLGNKKQACNDYQMSYKLGITAAGEKIKQYCE